MSIFDYLYEFHHHIGIILIGLGGIYMALYVGKYVRGDSVLDWRNKLSIYLSVVVIIIGFAVRLFGGFFKYL